MNGAPTFQEELARNRVWRAEFKTHKLYKAVNILKKIMNLTKAPAIIYIVIYDNHMQLSFRSPCKTLICVMLINNTDLLTEPEYLRAAANFTTGDGHRVFVTSFNTDVLQFIGMKQQNPPMLIITQSDLIFLHQLEDFTKKLVLRCNWIENKEDDIPTIWMVNSDPHLRCQISACMSKLNVFSLQSKIDKVEICSRGKDLVFKSGQENHIAMKTIQHEGQLTRNQFYSWAQMEILMMVTENYTKQLELSFFSDRMEVSFTAEDIPFHLKLSRLE